MHVEVTSETDPRLADYVSLRDAQLRRGLELGRGLFIAEGEKIIRRAAEAGAKPRSFLLQPRWLPALADIVDAWPDVPCLVAPEALIEQVSGFHVHRGALASFTRPDEAGWDDLLAGSRLLVCEDIVDHANIGSIMRVAAALGWDGVVVSAGSADPLYRRAIKASMGASLQLPWRRMAGDRDLDRLRDAGFTLAATTLSPAAIPLETYRAPARLALLLGTEGHGLSERWRQAADVELTIVMGGGVDSLNVATAAAIFAHRLR